MDSEIFGTPPRRTTRQKYMVFTIINNKLEIICDMLHMEYLKMREKNVNILRTMNSKTLIHLTLLF